MAMAEEAWMARAIALAERGRGSVEPNPLVGAVVVREGVCVGEGWHERYGGPHAEVRALEAAGAAARGATLYVTLEPCCHFGKTPPCTDAVLRAGVGRVVAAMADPFPQVAGRGAAILREAGVVVDVGVGEGSARRLNAPYLKLLATGRPYVHLKWAMTLDGKIATRTGDSRWISNSASRGRVHELRGRMDAVIVGVGTALADDPALTARPAGPRVASRVVFDSGGRLPSTSRLAATARETPTIVFVAADAAVEQLRRLEALGCEVLKVPTTSGRPEVTAVLAELGRRRFTNVLVEGGGHLLGSFFDAGEADELHVFIGQKAFGGREALSPVGGIGCGTVADAWKWSGGEVEVLDGDVYVRRWR